MPAPKILPTTDVLMKMRREGKTYQDIATAYGVTKGAVYLALRQAGKTGTRRSYTETIPWRVKNDHIHDYPAMMLRLLARLKDGRGDDIPDYKRRLLDRWMSELRERDLVVTYDPRIPPNPASRNGGWAYVPREPGDEDFIRPPSGDALVREV